MRLEQGTSGTRSSDDSRVTRSQTRKKRRALTPAIPVDMLSAVPSMDLSACDPVVLVSLIWRDDSCSQ